MKCFDHRRLLPLTAAVAAFALTITACGQRTDTPTDRPQGNSTATGTAPNTTSSPANTAEPTTGSTQGTSATTASTTSGSTTSGSTTSGSTASGSTTASTSSAPASIANTDREFIALAASSDMLEMQTGRLALDKSKNAGVRKFAQAMIDAHTKASENLKQVASQVGAQPPASMAPPHQAHLEKLQSLSGAEFDREYAAQIGVAAHQEAVALFERASREAANADVRGFAEKSLPTKRGHLEDGQALAKSLSVPAERLKMANAPPDLSSLSATVPSGPNNTTSTTGSGSTSGTDVSKSGATTPSK